MFSMSNCVWHLYFIHAEECDEIYYRLKGVTTVANMFTDDVIYIATDKNLANDCKDMLSKVGSGGDIFSETMKLKSEP